MELDYNKILLISCYFPPTGGSQVQRALSLARYLPDNGFSVHVLTVRNPQVPTFDQELVSRIPSSVQVHRTLTLEPPFHLRKKIWSRLKGGPSARTAHVAFPTRGMKAAISGLVSRALCPDPQTLWRPTATRAMRKLIQKHRIGNVIVTAPPFSALQIGVAAKRLFPNVRLTLDFRDEWEFFARTFAFHGSEYVYNQCKVMEAEAIHVADHVVAVTGAALETIRRRYPAEPESKFSLVPNGYDAEFFQAHPLRLRQADSCLRVVHTGTLCSYTSPDAYLQAIDRLAPKLQSCLRTTFVGRIAEEFPRDLFASRSAKIELVDFLPQRQARELTEDADLLLLVGLDPLSVSGKFYEYLAARKPILAFAPVGRDVADILKRTGCGWCIDPNDIDGAVHQLTEIITGRARIRPIESEILRFRRDRLSTQYADVLRGLNADSDTLEVCHLKSELAG
jgi:glycosyltransferase involved in cell wall biosynthesis